MCKEAVVTWIEAYLGIYLEVLTGLSQDSRYSERESNSAPPELETEALPSEPTLRASRIPIYRLRFSWFSPVPSGENRVTLSLTNLFLHEKLIVADLFKKSPPPFREPECSSQIFPLARIQSHMTRIYNLFPSGFHIRILQAILIAATRVVLCAASSRYQLLHLRGFPWSL